LLLSPPPRSPFFPYTTLFRSYAEYAQAEAKLRSARAWAMEVWADNEATLDAGELLSTEQETLTRLMLNNTTWSVHAVGQTVYKRSEEHTSELQSRENLVCRLL